MPYLISILFCLSIVLCSAAAAQADGCPPFSAPVAGHENDDVVPCSCLPGFTFDDDQCRPLVTKSQPIMRPMTHAECKKYETDIRADQTNRCTANFYDCLTAKGMSSDSAWCAAGLLLFGSSHTRENAVGALITCGQQAQALWRTCTTSWDGCTIKAAQEYEAGLQESCLGH